MRLLLLISLFWSFFSCKPEECKKKYKYWAYDVVRTYPNCADTAIYSDSSYWKGQIAWVKFVNNKTNSTESYRDFDNNGIPKDYDKIVIKDKMSSLYMKDRNNKLYLVSEKIKINDSIMTASYYYKNGKLESNGNLTNGFRCGQWVEYDSLHLTKEIGIYLPIMQMDTIKGVYTDNLDISIDTVISSDGTRTGKWVKYDNSGKIIQETIY